jgi:hypothetical protein
LAHQSKGASPPGHWGRLVQGGKEILAIEKEEPKNGSVQTAWGQRQGGERRGVLGLASASPASGTKQQQVAQHRKATPARGGKKKKKKKKKQPEAAPTAESAKASKS